MNGTGRKILVVALLFGAIAFAPATARAASEGANLSVSAGSGNTNCGGGVANFTFLWANANFDFSGVSLDGTNQTPTASNTLTVCDDTGSGDGWSLSASGTYLTDGGGNTITGEPAFNASSWSCAGSGSCSLPSGTGAYNMPVAASAPVATVYVSANADTGMGESTTAPTVSVLVPNTTIAGSYSATWDFTLSSGP